MKNLYISILLFFCTSVMAQNPAEDFAAGEGTEAAPYLITNAQQLSNIRNYLGEENVDLHFKIGQNIDLSNLNWEPIGNTTTAFHGKLHGGGYELQGLNIGQNGNETYRYAGLFGAIKTGARIDSVRLVGGKIKTFESNSSCSGAIAGVAQANTTADGSTLFEIIITNCFSSIDFESFSLLNTEIGGMIGRAQAIAPMGTTIRLIFENCRNEGKIISHYSTSLLGGILGNNSSFDSADITLHFLNCSNTGEVGSPGDASYVGGILGNTFAENDASLLFRGCYNTGNISGGRVESYTGGIIGYARLFCESAIVENCYSVANIHTLDNYVGGIAGDILTGDANNIRVNHCYVAGSITGNAIYAGGIVGRSVESDADYVIENCAVILSSIENSSSSLGAAGRIVSISLGAELRNNYALSNMTINGNTVSSSNAASVDGADLSSRDFQTMTTYSDQLFWDIATNGSSAWTINEGKSYPYFPRQSTPPYIQTLYRDSLKIQLTNFTELLAISRTDTAEIIFETESVSSGTHTLPVNLTDYNAGTILALSSKELAKETSYPVWSSLQKRIITVVADQQDKCEDEDDPEFTYTVTPELIEGDRLEGTLTRQQGETPGIYYILQGTLNNPNYEIFYVRSSLTIKDCDSFIEVYDMKQDIAIYPNPVQDILFLSLGEKCNKVEFSLYNTFGQCVFHQSFNEIQEIETRLNITPGIYFTKLTIDGCTMKSRKIIKL